VSTKKSPPLQSVSSKFYFMLSSHLRLGPPRDSYLGIFLPNFYLLSDAVFNINALLM